MAALALKPFGIFAPKSYEEQFIRQTSCQTDINSEWESSKTRNISTKHKKRDIALGLTDSVRVE